MIKNPLSALTERQLQVAYMRLFMTKGEIAEALQISPHTVHNHVRNAINRLDLKKATAIYFMLGRYGAEDLPVKAFYTEEFHE